MKAIIYKPAKNVMQSGRGKAQDWVLEYDEPIARGPESLNGWTSANATTGQVRMSFATLEQAQHFAEKNALAYFVRAEQNRKVRPRNFMDNYKYQPFDDKK